MAAGWQPWRVVKLPSAAHAHSRPPLCRAALSSPPPARQAKVMEKHGAYIARCSGRRARQNKKRLARETTAMFKKVRAVNGTLTCQEMFRVSKGSVGDNDVSILLLVYVPLTQRTFKFDIPDKQLRELLYQVREGARLLGARGGTGGGTGFASWLM